MAGIKDPKVATKKNKEFRNKTKAWVAREAERRGIKNRKKNRRNVGPSLQKKSRVIFGSLIQLLSG